MGSPPETMLAQQAITAKQKGSQMTRSRQVLTGVAVVAIVVALVAIPVLLYAMAGPSPSPLATTTLSSPSRLPMASPSATGSPFLMGNWRVLAASDTVGASWSPDGNWLAVWDRVTNGTPDEQHLRLLDKTGKQIRVLNGDYLVWVDATHFVITRASESFLGSVDANDVTPLAVAFPDGAVSNDHGAVAIETIPSNPADTSFVVWTQNGTSQPIAGEPEAWSRDGTKLAVWHYVAPSGSQSAGSQPPGWVEVLSWPSLHAIVTENSPTFARQPMSFDPSGRYLLAPQASGACVIDLSDGALIGPTGVGMGSTPAWDSTGDPVVANFDGSATTYPVSGRSPTTLTGVGDSVSASADGSTLVFYFAQSAGPVTLVRGGSTQTVQTPGPVQPTPALSPDGSGVIVICLVDQQQYLLLLAA